MPTTYPSSPYFDDYDETKQFYRILFRPGRAVQARELTQLQTMLQAQIERFGRGIYKEGSFVTPPKETYDPNYSFVKLQTSYNSVSANDVIASLVDTIVIGQTTGVRARVVNFTASTTAGDPPTIFVKYLNSGTNGTTSSFADNEVIINAASTVSVRAATSSATGTGTAYSLGTSVVFAKGNFLYVEEQTLIVEKYASVSDRIIGFAVSESTIESDDDTSLLDPAINTFNYFAPGADRYKIVLALTSRSLTPSTSDDPNFIEILRIEDGIIISRFVDPRLSVIGDTLARRTYDESGDYIVNPFNVELIEHLRTTSPTNASTDVRITRDGLYPSANGGDASLFVTNITPGKAYVRGYEVNNIPTKYINISKARDFANVNSGVVATQLSSYVNIDGVYSIPAFGDIASVDLYDRYTSSFGNASGTKVGTARARGLQYLSGNVADKSATFQLYLFDVVMDSGYTFERDAKQIFSDNTGFADFTANITPTLVTLTGSATAVTSSNVITGTGTRFSTELTVGDFITLGTQRFLVNSISSDVSLIAVNNASANVTGQLFNLNTAKINDADKDTFIIPFPFEVIKTVDPTNAETTYTTKRQYSRTLAAGQVTVTASTDETFAPFSSDNYAAVITSGGRAGEYVVLNSTIVSRGGSPTGTTVTFDLSGEGLTTETVQLYTTINKTNSASLEKTKTLVTDATVDFITKADAQATILSLGKADGFRLKSVRMSNVAFGASYVEAGSSNITARYTFDNGQKATYYDLAKVVLNPGQAKPTNPIRVTFDYFTHGTGDFFSVDSYSGIDYKIIPTITIGQTTYKLRDCLDFRPRINDAGTGFTSTGSSTTEFIDPEIDYQTDYQYYLPKINVIGIDKDGLYYVANGISSLNPIEPELPTELLKLFILKQKAYVFDLNQDVDVIRVENKRYTMKDIGKIDNRVKTLEYYTTLSLLERDAQQDQIQDDLGFERFKNGFLVDSFTGHGVGDSVDNPDYAVSVNYKTKEASPLIVSKFLDLKEEAASTASRTSNNYVLTGEVVTLPFTETTFLENRFSSKTESLNPFNVVTFQGKLTLDPPGDLWFQDTRSPDIIVDQTGSYDSLSASSLIKKDGTNIFGSINDIEQFRNGIPPDVTDLPDNLKALVDLIGSVSPATTTLTSTGKEVIKNVTVIPKMRDASIKFTAQGLRPNTRFYVYFDELNVTNFCLFENSSVTTAFNALDTNSDPAQFESLGEDLADATEAAGVASIVSDSTGSVSGVFKYSSSSLNLSTGKKLFRITNSRTNNRVSEDSFAEQFFFTDGIQRDIANEVLRPPPPPPPQPTPVAVAQQITFESVPDRGIQEEPVYEQPPSYNQLETVYLRLTGSLPDSGGYNYWDGLYDVDNLTDEALTHICQGFVSDGMSGLQKLNVAGGAGKEVNRGVIKYDDAVQSLVRIAKSAL